MREYPALVDVGNDDHRAINRLGKAHIGDIAFTQIDLGRRTGAFHHHDLRPLAKASMGCQHRLHRGRLVGVVAHRIHAADRVAVDDYLRAHVGIGLEQNRVHVGVGRQPRGLRLHRLRPANLAAIGGHCSIQRHVLRFERHHHHVLANQPAAQGADQRTFAGIGGGALHHQRRHLRCLMLVFRACSSRSQSR